MNKLNKKELVDREAKYLPFKSYHKNNQKSRNGVPQEQTESSEPTKVKKSKQKSEPIARQLSAYRGDGTGRIVLSGSVKNNLKHSESQTSNVPLQTYEQLKVDLALLQEAKSKLNEEITQLKVNIDDHQNTNENLKKIITDLELKNEELHDQCELNSDQIKELLKLNSERAERLKQLESKISSFENDRDVAKSRSEELDNANKMLENSNRELENSNKELTQLINELRSVSEKKDLAFDRHVTNMKKKWESYQMKLDKALREKDELTDLRANDAKFAAMLEKEMNALQQIKGELENRNEEMQRSQTERKKTEEILRQKYDELKLRYKTMMERGAKYLMYDPVDGMGSSSSSIIGKEVNSKGLRASSASLMPKLTRKHRENQDTINQNFHYNRYRSNEVDIVSKKKKSLIF